MSPTIFEYKSPGDQVRRKKLHYWTLSPGSLEGHIVLGENTFFQFSFKFSEIKAKIPNISEEYEVVSGLIFN
jgi:hypothetical protein